MEIRQLRYFVGIAETGRFSEASKQLFISQSAVSQQIKLLEEELGAQLFVRGAHSVTLTEAGIELLPIARRVLQGVSACYDKMSDLKGLLCGELNIGLTYSLESYMRETMVNFMKEYPRVTINAHYKNLYELLPKLQSREIDIMLSMMPTSPHDFCDSEWLMNYRLTAIMRKNHPLACHTELNFSDLLPHSIVLPEKGLRDRNAIESYIHAETGKLNIRSYVNDVSALLNLVQDINIITILSENEVNNRPLLRSVPIAELSTPVKVYAHFNRETNRKHSAEVFLQMFRETSAFYLNRSTD